MTQSTAHIWIKMTPPNYTLFCEHCGDEHVLHTGCSIDMALAQMDAYGKQHKRCKAPKKKDTAA